ncbi:hypothetical protein BESB_016210 [Besnoitia besnoiti]|uniref:Transmembrane protein n=1 Tax=Besnoitia besnoiti TaxID=94643 RepID=A0A2A9M9E9_BESBE|nr:hypothetical protein BESB_016210 [Besnoitia besnoiti]PFH32303.1 hypothetical protein BESB_016210 [Besnoitia besnoiti]
MTTTSPLLSRRAPAVSVSQAKNETHATPLSPSELQPLSSFTSQHFPSSYSSFSSQPCPASYSSFSSAPRVSLSSSFSPRFASCASSSLAFPPPASSPSSSSAAASSACPSSSFSFPPFSSFASSSPSLSAEGHSACRQLTPLASGESTQSGSVVSGRSSLGALSPLSVSVPSSLENLSSLTSELTTQPEVDGRDLPGADFLAEIERFVATEEERDDVEFEEEADATRAQANAFTLREMQTFAEAPAERPALLTEKARKPLNRRSIRGHKKGAVLLPRFSSPPLSCDALSSLKAPPASAFKDPPCLAEEDDERAQDSRRLKVFTVCSSSSPRYSVSPYLLPHAPASFRAAEYPLQDFPPVPAVACALCAHAAASAAPAFSPSSSPSLSPAGPATEPLLAQPARPVERSEETESDACPRGDEDGEGAKKDTFITASVFFREQRFSSSISCAMFLLGVGVFLPWNCLVMEMATFDVAYFPTFPWTEAATQVRTACFFLGQLLLLWLGPRLQLIPRTVSTLIFSILTNVALALVAVCVPENPAFHICCVLSGIIGLQGSLLHASVYVLHAVIHHELAVDWSIGGGLAGPLTALLAFPLYFLLPASKQGQRIGTVLLFSFSALWSLLAAAALCLGARHPLASPALLKQEEEVRRSLSGLEWTRATSSRLSRSLSWWASAGEAAKAEAGRGNEPEAGGGEVRTLGGNRMLTATSRFLRTLSRGGVRQKAKRRGKKDLTVGEVAAAVEKAAIAGEDTPHILGPVHAHHDARTKRWRMKEGAEEEPLLPLAEGPCSARGADDSPALHSCEKALASSAWQRRDVFRAIRPNLLTCFLLFLSTYLIYPVKTERLWPSSSLDFVLFQMILVACFQAGNVLGRFCVFWGCRARFSWLLPLVVLRLLLIPLFFVLDGTLVLPSSWFSLHLSSPSSQSASAPLSPSSAAASLAAASDLGSLSTPASHAFVVPPPSSSAAPLSGPPPLSLSASLTSPPALPSTDAEASARSFSHFLSANEAWLADCSLFLLLMLFATMHGWLSVLGAFYATQVPCSTPQKETAAYLMCVAESCGVAVGVALSVMWASLTGHHPLSPHKASAVAAAAPSANPPGDEADSAFWSDLDGGALGGPRAASGARASRAPLAAGSAGAARLDHSIGLQTVPKLG